jgi:hypothetical protein
LAVGEALWAGGKATCPTYHYAIGTSWFAGVALHGSRETLTTIEIKDDSPTARRYEEAVMTEPAGGGITAGWIETANIGAHAAGQPAETMEQLYADCSSHVLSQDPATAQITFQADTRGALQQCWYISNSCVDDCTPSGCAGNCKIGVVVSGFECAALEPAPPSSFACGGSTARIQVATIHVTASTNSPTVDVQVYCDGSAARDVVTTDAANPLALTSKIYEAGSPEVLSFLTDFGAVGDVTGIPTGTDCAKSVSFGTTTTVAPTLGAPSGDLQCLKNPSASQAALAHDAAVLTGQI